VNSKVLEAYSCRHCRGWTNGATCIRLVRDGVCAKQQLSRLTNALVLALQGGDGWRPPAQVAFAVLDGEEQGRGHNGS